LVARLAGLKSIASGLPVNLRLPANLLNFFSNQYQTIQHILVAYIIIIILMSNALFYFGKQDREPAFIITAIGMIISSNILWYHHYVFVLLPLLIWMGWSRLDWRAVAWCLLGLLVIQIDRYELTGGLLIHIFCHISILILLIRQWHVFISSRRQRLHPALDSLTI